MKPTLPILFGLKTGGLNGWAEEPVLSGIVWVWSFISESVSEPSGLQPLPTLWSSMIIAVGCGQAPTTLSSGLISFHQRQQIQTGYLGWSPRNLAKYYSNCELLPEPNRKWDMAGTGSAHTRLSLVGCFLG